VRHDCRKSENTIGGGAGVAIPSSDEPVPELGTCDLHALTSGYRLHEGGAAIRPGIVHIYPCGNAAPRNCCLKTGRKERGETMLAILLKLMKADIERG